MSYISFVDTANAPIFGIDIFGKVNELNDTELTERENTDDKLDRRNKDVKDSGAEVKSNQTEIP